MDHSKHIRLSANEVTPDNLDGATVYGPGDETVGTISHTHDVGSNMQVVIDVGGFLGIGAKPVAVPVRDLDVMRDEDGTVHAVTSFTRERLKELPEHRDPMG